MNRPALSVIVPYYDEAEHLEACLRSLLSQKGPSFEVLAVDDGSSDASARIARALAARSRGRLRLLSQDHRGPGAARNLAARQAKGRALVFVDADMRAAPGFLKRISAPVLAGKEDGTYVVDELVSNPGNPWSRAWSLAHGLPPGRRLPEGAGQRANTYRCIRRDCFLKAGGHREERGVAEDEMDTSKVRPALAVPGAVLYHANPASASEVWAQARWFGRGKASYLGLWQWNAMFLRHWLPRSLAASLWGGLKHGSAFYVFFKLFFDLAVCLGLWQGRLFGLKAR